MLSRVVFPLPFSPSRAWISPFFSCRVMSSFALIPGNTLVMWSISITYSGVVSMSPPPFLFLQQICCTRNRNVHMHFHLLYIYYKQIARISSCFKKKNVGKEKPSRRFVQVNYSTMFRATCSVEARLEKSLSIAISPETIFWNISSYSSTLQFSRDQVSTGRPTAPCAAPMVTHWLP